MTFQHLNLQLLGPSYTQGQAQVPHTPSGHQDPPNSPGGSLDVNQSTAQAKAAATRQSARIACIGANETADSPAPGVIQLTPLPGAPAAKQAAKQSAKQAAKQPALRQRATTNTGPEPNPGPTSTQPLPNQSAELDALRACILQLEQEQAGWNNATPGPSPMAPTSALFVSLEEVEKARAAITTSQPLERW
ncbi:hypothetical protein BDR06DRAFT_1006111 [Suillus hirtellus]|nr:hypothetical protein BDR06DRAFT_1006111 [Suillus hirtellus]